jgi:glucose/arabinose dehydrogenase
MMPLSLRLRNRLHIRRIRELSLLVLLAALILAGILLPLSPASPAPAWALQAPFQLQLEPFATGFTEPVKIAHANDDRLFVVEQQGRIYVVQADGTRLPTPFLNLSDRVATGGERGLLGMVFEPDDPTTFYLNYTRRSGNADENGDTVISRFRVSATDSNRGDPDSEEIVLVIDQPFSNHNAGDMAFGPDRFLYIPMGDGGSGGDPRNYAQNLNELLGKVLRIDVVGQQAYAIPPDNPFATDGDPNTRAEIWSYGWRNPWRFSFDRVTGELYIADVGQNDWEEINVEPPNIPGLNYGWKLCEGNYAYPRQEEPELCTATGVTPPVFDYSHEEGQSVTGGYVYRGSRYPSLVGHYFFADYISGRFWTLVRDGQGNWVPSPHGRLGINFPSTFGEDKDGELYVASRSGTIYRITTPLPPVTPPALTPQSYLPFIQLSE